MATCKDCLQNCPEIISDQCVQYTGPALAAPLNVCTGDQLPVYEANIAAALLTALNGNGIIPLGVTLPCTWLSQQLGVLPANLNNLLQTLSNATCSLYTSVTAIQAQIAPGASGSGTVLDTMCLTLPANPTSGQITQSIINLLCSVNTTVAAIPTTYVRNTDLTSLVTTIINNVTTGTINGVPQYNVAMVPYAAIAYFGPLSNFDATGAGLSSTGFNKIFLCNGNNGTPDIRGRIVVSAIRNVPGGALDPAVDPSVNPNNPNWALSDKAGTTTSTLTTSQIPSHTHTINDSGHAHNLGTGGVVRTTAAGPGSYSGGGANSSGVPALLNTLSNTTGITIAATGGGQPHNNIQPSIAAYYIMYIP